MESAPTILWKYICFFGGSKPPPYKFLGKILSVVAIEHIDKSKFKNLPLAFLDNLCKRAYNGGEI